MNKNRTQIGRRFLGDIGIVYLEDGKTKDRDANNRQKKHLRSYLKGLKFFIHGKDIYGKPMRYEVQQEYYNK